MLTKHDLSCEEGIKAVVNYLSHWEKNGVLYKVMLALISRAFVTTIFFFFRNHGLLFQTLEAPLIVSNLSILSLATRQYQQSDLEICERPWPYQICFAFRVLHFYEILRFSLLSCPVSLDYTECVHCTVGGPLVAHVLFNLGDFKEKNQGKIIGKVCLFRLSVISIATRVVTSHCMGSCTNKISARLRTCQILAVVSSN